LQDENQEIEWICATKEWVADHPEIAEERAMQLLVTDEFELKKISNLSTPNQVLAVVRQNHTHLRPDELQESLVLFLDGIQDPGNMGTILRIADWFGIPSVICSPMCVDVYNPKVIQATMGAIFRIKTVEMDFGELVFKFPQLTFYGAVLDGQNIFQMELPQHGVIVIGNESSGISASIQEQLDYQISIPSGKNGGAESLNAAVATGIICAAFCK